MKNTNDELNNTKDELKKTNADLQETIGKVNFLEKELEKLKQSLSKKPTINVINEFVETKEEKGDTINIDEKKTEINFEIDNLKKQLRGIKLKIFEEAMTLTKWMKFIYEADNYVEIINNLSKSLVNAKYAENMNKEQITKKASQLINEIINQ